MFGKKELRTAIFVALLTLVMLLILDKFFQLEGFDDLSAQLNEQQQQQQYAQILHLQQGAAGGGGVPLTAPLALDAGGHKLPPRVRKHSIQPVASSKQQMKEHLQQHIMREDVGSGSSSSSSSSSSSTVAAAFQKEAKASHLDFALNSNSSSNSNSNSRSSSSSSQQRLQTFFPAQGDAICSREVGEAYKQLPGAGGGGSGSSSKGKAPLHDRAWCVATREAYSVELGRSWGALPRSMQMEWDEAKCNELLVLGKLRSCDERWGWGSFDAWLSSPKRFVKGGEGGKHGSSVDCVSNVQTSTFCHLQNVVIDFDKAHVSGKSRTFLPGFLTTYGKQTNTRNAHSQPSVPEVPGRLHIERTKDEPFVECDEALADTTGGSTTSRIAIEHRPTFIISNDDIYNLGHYINDVMTVWNMLVLANKNARSSLLINIDGVRKGGPAGGPAHRLMVPTSPDEHGPFIGYYNSWFSEIRKAIDYQTYTNTLAAAAKDADAKTESAVPSTLTNRVCFKSLYFQPLPGVPWFWNDWGVPSECSLQSASPLYQSFNLFMRNMWAQTYGIDSLPNPPTDKVHVVIEARKIDKNKKNNHSSARHIRNIEELVAALEQIPLVKVTVQNFAALTFDKQVALSHSAGVFVSMHGAGTTHIFHSALGKPNCCALVELQPDHSIGFQTAHGYANLARMHGMHYYRYEAADGSTSDEGTMVDVELIAKLVSQV